MTKLGEKNTIGFGAEFAQGCSKIALLQRVEIFATNRPRQETHMKTYIVDT